MDLTPPLQAAAEHLTHPKYRPDIDGLRAVAVLSVVIYHAFPAWLRGGFIGVDIFFVISGYLISTIIFSSLQTGGFNFLEFYARRVRRIFPALMVVLITSYVIGWNILFSIEFEELGKHIAGGAGFVSNLVLWSESGYFDSEAVTKPLLHLWSLGIEEQFYLVWPMLLWVTWRSHANVLVMVVLVAGGSFFFNVFQIGRDAVAVFYSPQTRFWELLAGSLLAYAGLRRGGARREAQTADADERALWVVGLIRVATGPGNIPSLVGAALIGMGLVVISEDKPFPGWWALAPTLGACLLISGGSRAWVNRVILSNRVMVWFGLISFPLYLWHWPLLSFARIVEAGLPSREIRALAVAAAIGLAWTTYVWVERPLRFGRNSRKKTLGLIAVMTVVGLVGYATYFAAGIENRRVMKNAFKPVADGEADYRRFKATVVETTFAERADAARLAALRWPVCNFGSERVVTHQEFAAKAAKCLMPSEDKPNVLILGDSHAADLWSALSSSYPKYHFLEATSAGCIPLHNPMANTNQMEGCRTLVNHVYDSMSLARIDLVIISARWPAKLGLEQLYADALKIRNRGPNVLVAGPTMEFKTELPKLLLRDKDPNRNLKQEPFQLDRKMSAFFKDKPAIGYFSKVDFQCPANRCEWHDGTRVNVFDYGHHTLAGMAHFGRHYADGRLIENNLSPTLGKGAQKFRTHGTQ